MTRLERLKVPTTAPHTHALGAKGAALDEDSNCYMEACQQVSPRTCHSGNRMSLDSPPLARGSQLCLILTGWRARLLVPCRQGLFPQPVITSAAIAHLSDGTIISGGVTFLGVGLMPEPRALLVCQPFFLFPQAGYYASHHQGDASSGKDDPGGEASQFYERCARVRHKAFTAARTALSLADRPLGT